MTTIGTDGGTKAGIAAGEPQIMTKTRYGSKNYELLIGYVKNGELPQYIVRNLETGVVEFNHEVLSFAREWINHFQGRLDALDAGKDPDAAASVDAMSRTASFN